MNKGLGRLPAPDARDTEFPLRAAVRKVEPTRSYRYWYRGTRLDQGASSTCVGHAWTHFVENSPITHPHDNPVDPFTLYDAAQLADEWPGEDYDGTSVRAGAKVLKDWGLISEYRWAFSLDDVILGVLELGPVVVGTDWYEGMFTPDANGFLTLSGGVVGGHAWVVDGCNLKTRRFRMLNSWGPAWGRDGGAWIEFEDFERLLYESGEAAIALERV